MTVGAAGARQSAGREVGALPRAGAKAAVRRMARDHLGRPRVLRALAGGRTRGLGATSLNLLLDTHALLWWLAGDRALSPITRTAIADESSAVVVSAATAWETTTRFRLGRLP